MFRRILTITVATFACGSALSACSSSSSSSPSGACNTVVNDAAEVTNTAVSGATPVGTGSTIVSGLYHLTARTDYTGGGSAGSHKLKVTLNITPSSAQGVWKEDAEDNVANVTLTTTPSGGMTFAVTCPAAGVAEWDSYTATPTTVTLYSSSKKKSVTLTK